MAEPDPPPGPKKKSSVVSKLIEWLVVTLIALGAGAALTAMNPPSAPPSQAASDRAPSSKLSQERRPAQAAQAAVVCGPGGPSMVDMPPIVTNIANPTDTWVRLEASIVFDPKALPHPDVVAAEIATDELAYLRTVSLGRIAGAGRPREHPAGSARPRGRALWRQSH